VSNDAYFACVLVAATTAVPSCTVAMTVACSNSEQMSYIFVQKYFVSHIYYFEAMKCFV